MKNSIKRYAGKIVVALMIIILVGIPILFLCIITSLGAAPLYVAKTVPVAGIALIITLVTAAVVGLTSKQLKILWSVFFCICIGCGIYMGIGAYHDSIATVDDRNLLLYKYRPFSEGNLLATLDEPSDLEFDMQTANNLKLDGATALYPVYSAFVQAVYPNAEYRRDGVSPVDCTNTVGAYERLIKGDVDIIFVAGPSEDQLKMAKQNGVQLHLTPIGREAFVFFVNSKNPVEGLTVEQIQKIYTGEITNWSEVGGNNQKIRPFQRAQNSGSQTYLEKLMQGLPLMEPESEDRIGGMGGIIRQVAAYRNYKNALGFSFRYYASEMDSSGEIKLLALNGVAPTKDTIRDGSYPIASEFYAVTASKIGQPSPYESGLESDKDVKAFIDWILSPQGQELIEKTGYVALG